MSSIGSEISSSQSGGGGARPGGPRRAARSTEITQSHPQPHCVECAELNPPRLPLTPLVACALRARSRGRARSPAPSTVRLKCRPAQRSRCRGPHPFRQIGKQDIASRSPAERQAMTRPASSADKMRPARSIRILRYSTFLARAGTSRSSSMTADSTTSDWLRGRASEPASVGADNASERTFSEAVAACAQAPMWRVEETLPADYRDPIILLFSAGRAMVISLGDIRNI